MVPFSNGTTGLGVLGLWIFIGFERAEVAKAQVMTTLMRIWSMVEDGLYWRSADVIVYPQEATVVVAIWAPRQQPKCGNGCVGVYTRAEVNDLQTRRKLRKRWCG
jgi:hypothetical protein